MVAVTWPGEKSAMFCDPSRPANPPLFVYEKNLPAATLIQEIRAQVGSQIGAFDVPDFCPNVINPPPKEIPVCQGEPLDNQDVIRWLQTALNKLLGLQLAVNGFADIFTRSALRSFKIQKRMRPDSVLDRNTQLAIEAAGGSPASCRLPPGPMVLEFLGPQRQAIIQDTTAVGFGLFDGAVEQDPNPRSGPPAADPLLNEESEARNFVGSDSRRFHIRLTNPPPEDPELLADGRRVVKVELFTTFGTGQVLDNNDGQPMVTLVEEGPGVFISRGLMLTTTIGDQRLATNCGIANRYPGADVRRFGQTDHRIRLATMFGRVNARYAPSDQSKAKTEIATLVFPVSQRKRLPLQILVVARADGSPSVTTGSVLGRSLRKTREIYERLGIFVQTAAHPIAETNSLRKDFGGLEGRDFLYVIRPVNSRSTFGRQEKDIAAQRFPRTSDLIRVFFTQDPGSRDSFPDVDHPLPVRGSVFIPDDGNPSEALMAHEVGHLLTDKSTHFGLIADPNTSPPFPNQGGGHFQRPLGQNRFIHFYNLLGGTRFRLWNVFVTEQSDHVPPQTKTFNQVQDILRSRFLRD